MNSQLLQQLVALRGIETRYTDAWGNPATISEVSQSKLLTQLGYDLSSEETVSQQLAEEHELYWTRPLAPVFVLREGHSVSIEVRVPISAAAQSHKFSIVTESGDVHAASVKPVDHQLTHVNEVNGMEYHAYQVDLPVSLPLGYHQLHLTHVGRKKCAASARLIIAPVACYTPSAIAQGKKIWGLSVQLYCLRSRSNWGIGDFTDLTRLITYIAPLGADFVGLNPIHALYPANPDACSPYGPSSRRWLNYLYIDVTRVPGYEDAAVATIVNHPDFMAQLDALRRHEHVDYAGVTQVKMRVLAEAFEAFKRTATDEARDVFAHFVSQGGESLRMLATYDALQARLKQEGQPSWGWPVFPDEYKDYQSQAVLRFQQDHEEEIAFYAFLQWQAAEQLQQASQAARDAGMTIGVYRDLAVGVSEGSAEIWGNKSLYCTNASIGAPPDILGPLGQNWGLPPMDPRELVEQGYQPIIDLFSSNMNGTGALRIDHVMALLRLWWVNRGDNAKDGGYVYYPVDDLLAILALESHRHQSLVIGEDLGTVPDEIRSKLADNGVYSYRVFFFEQAEDGGFFSPSHYPIQSMATLTTHDMPTLSGYWHCYDLELGKMLGLYPTDEILSQLYLDRHTNKQEILNSLHGHGAIANDVSRDVNYTPMTRSLNFGMQVHMATGSSALLSLQLEDWLEMDKPVNIPGTFNEYPNWRRKLVRNLEDIFADPALIALARSLSNARQKASEGHPQ